MLSWKLLWTSFRLYSGCWPIKTIVMSDYTQGNNSFVFFFLMLLHPTLSFSDAICVCVVQSREKSCVFCIFSHGNAYFLVLDAFHLVNSIVAQCIVCVQKLYKRQFKSTRCLQLSLSLFHFSFAIHQQLKDVMQFMDLNLYCNIYIKLNSTSCIGSYRQTFFTRSFLSFSSFLRYFFFFFHLFLLVLCVLLLKKNSLTSITTIFKSL